MAVSDKNLFNWSINPFTNKLEKRILRKHSVDAFNTGIHSNSLNITFKVYLFHFNDRQI